MSSVSFKIVKYCISLFAFFGSVSIAKAWEVDLSRRKTDFDRIEDRQRGPASQDVKDSFLSVASIIEPMLPVQDVVVLATAEGFVPDKVYLRRGQNYRINLVNINDQKRNTSFILDDFAESHATPYGVNKSFEIKPQKMGEYVFHSPETTYRGRIVVVDPAPRAPASAAKSIKVKP
ncbi:MAG: cupredoxin domain-containing protein, partial [Bdellovibrionales bacterium]